MVKHALRESLPTCLLTQSCDEPERLGDGQVCTRLDEGSSLTLVFLEHAPTTHVHARVHPAHGFLWAHDLNQEHWFLKSWLSHHLRCETRTTSWRHDLTCATVNGVCVQGYIREVEANAAHVLLTDRTLLRTP